MNPLIGLCLQLQALVVVFPLQGIEKGVQVQTEVQNRHLGWHSMATASSNLWGLCVLESAVGGLFLLLF